MEYRRFGKTELQMPVISCGGMRYQQGWKDLPPDEIDEAVQKNVKATIDHALDVGINHIETARGYGSSEYQLGRFLKDYPRDEIIVQTKVSPQESPEKFLEVFETSMANLQLDYIDLFAFHGLNTDELTDKVLNQGQIEVALKLKEQGRLRHIGFSTHGMTSSIMKTIESDAFDYINLHYYYTDQVNEPCVTAAAERDMGVFIISPSDKGGQLYKAPDKLTELCKPLTPVGFNGLFCLADERIHTLSMGASKPEDFKDLLDIVDKVPDAATHMQPVKDRLDAEIVKVCGADWADNWWRDIPEFSDIPGEVNLYQVLRLLTYYEAFDMLEFAKFRYNMLGGASHWFPGYKVDAMDWDKLPEVIASSPIAEVIPEKLRLAHERFNAEDKKRLSESE